jgi:hypothetical protein
MIPEHSVVESLCELDGFPVGTRGTIVDVYPNVDGYLVEVYPCDREYPFYEATTPDLRLVSE